MSSTPQPPPSRFSRTPAQEESQRRFQQNEAKRLRVEATKNRELKKQARERALAGIHHDREDRRARCPRPFLATAATSDSVSSATAPQAEAAAPSAAASCHTDQSITVQVRLLDSSQFRDTFQPSDLLACVLDRICIRHPSINRPAVILRQAFPAVSYGEFDHGKSLAELGFHKRTQLVLSAKPDAAMGVLSGESVSTANVRLLPNDEGPHQDNDPLPAEDLQENDPLPVEDLQDNDPLPVEDLQDNDPLAVEGLPLMFQQEQQQPELVFELPAAAPQQEPPGFLDLGPGHILGGIPAAPNPENKPQAVVAAGRRNLRPVYQEKSEGDVAARPVVSVPSLESLAMACCAKSLPTILMFRPAFVRNLKCGKIAPWLASTIIVSCLKTCTADSAMKLIMAFRDSLFHLYLDGFERANSALISKVSLLRNLIGLSLDGCKLLTSSCLEPLSRLERLQFLELSGCSRMIHPGATLPNFSRLTNLLSLGLDFCGVTDSLLDGIISCTPAVLRLSVCHSNITSDSIIAIGQHLPRIQDLAVSSTKVVSLNGIQSLTCIRQLALSSCSIDESTLQHLQPLQSLVSLDLSFVNLSSSALVSAIANLPIAKLCLPRLKLNPGDDVALLRMLLRFRLAEVDLCNIFITNTAFCRIEENLGHLRPDLVTTVRLDNAGIGDEELASCVRVFTRVRTLSLKGCVATSEGFRVLAGLHSLRQLNLSHSTADDELVKSGVFFDTVHLTSLDLSFTHVTSDGIMSLRSCMLEFLNITGMPQPNRSWNASILRNGCPRLDRILAEQVL